MFVWNSQGILINYYGFVVDELSELVYTINRAEWSLIDLNYSTAGHGLK